MPVRSLVYVVCTFILTQASAGGLVGLRSDSLSLSLKRQVVALKVNERKEDEEGAVRGDGRAVRCSW